MRGRLENLAFAGMRDSATIFDASHHILCRNEFRWLKFHSAVNIMSPDGEQYYCTDNYKISSAFVNAVISGGGSASKRMTSPVSG